MFQPLRSNFKNHSVGAYGGACLRRQRQIHLHSETPSPNKHRSFNNRMKTKRDKSLLHSIYDDVSLCAQQRWLIHGHGLSGHWEAPVSEETVQRTWWPTWGSGVLPGTAVSWVCLLALPSAETPRRTMSRQCPGLFCHPSTSGAFIPRAERLDRVKTAQARRGASAGKGCLPPRQWPELPWWEKTDSQTFSYFHERTQTHADFFFFFNPAK